MQKKILKYLAQPKEIQRFCRELLSAHLISRSEFFDKDWYLEHNPDVKAAGIDPALHFLRYGDSQGRDPGPAFNVERYLHLHPDVRTANINSLLHYLRYGRREKRQLAFAASGQGPEQQEMLDIYETNYTSIPLTGYTRMGNPEYGPIQKVLAFDQVCATYTDLSVCVQLHLFHKDSTDQVVQYLNNIPFDFTLLVSLRDSDSETEWEEFFKSKVSHARTCIARRSVNKGRDVAPWVVLFKNEILEHDLMLHVHTKKSEHTLKYKFWWKFLFHNMVGSKGVVSQIYNIFEEQSNISLIYPPYYSHSQRLPSWGSNRTQVAALTQWILDKTAPRRCPDFPAGSFFWCRTSTIRPLLESGITFDDFEEEEGQIDGTLAHAIERFIGILGLENNFKTLCITTDVAYNLTNYWNCRRCGLLPVLNNRDAPVTRVKQSPRADVLQGLKIAVFTAVIGQFDTLVIPPVIEEGVDYYCFTDKPVAPPYPYKNKITPYLDPNPRKTARFVKTHPHYLLRDYDIAIWVDANVVATNGLLEYAAMVVAADADVGVIRHPVRTSYIKEANECIRIGADDADIINEQIKFYKQANIPNDNLVETNVFISRPKNRAVPELFTLWWREINNRSIRDQISFGFSAFQSEVKEVEIFERGVSARDKDGFMLFAHDVKERNPVVAYVIQKTGV